MPDSEFSKWYATFCQMNLENAFNFRIIIASILLESLTKINTRPCGWHGGIYPEFLYIILVDLTRSSPDITHSTTKNELLVHNCAMTFCTRSPHICRRRCHETVQCRKFTYQMCLGKLWLSAWTDINWALSWNKYIPVVVWGTRALCDRAAALWLHFNSYS